MSVPPEPGNKAGAGPPGAGGVPVLTVETPTPACGAPLRLRLDGRAPMEWRVGRSVLGAQKTTNDFRIFFEGHAEPGSTVEVTLPLEGLPSFKGRRVEVAWWAWARMEGGDDTAVVTIPVALGRTAPDLPALEARGRDWLATDARGALLWGAAQWAQTAIGLLFVPALLLVAALQGAVAGTLLMLVAALMAVGIGYQLRAHLRDLAYRRRARSLVAEGVAVAFAGETFSLPVAPDRDAYKAAGMLDWALLREEREATVSKVYTGDPPRERTDTAWNVTQVIVSEGRVEGPPYGDRVLEVAVPADAPPTLETEHRRVAWRVRLRCGSAERVVPVWVAPYARAARGR
jgi:hypothetical protein